MKFQAAILCAVLAIAAPRPLFAGMFFRPGSAQECIDTYSSKVSSKSAQYYIRLACRHKFHPSPNWPVEVCECVLKNMKGVSSNLAAGYVKKACVDTSSPRVSTWPSHMCDCILKNMKKARNDGEAARILQRCRNEK